MILKHLASKQIADLLGARPHNGQRKRFALLEGIARGEKAIEDGLVLTHARAKKRMARWLKL